MKKLLALATFLLAFLNSTIAQLQGCPDPAASNYDSLVTVNNGSCTYSNASIKPKTLYNLNTVLNESSGLLYWNKLTWSHNDSGNDPVIYGMNAKTGAIQRTVTITNATNTDWEDIAQDSKFIYIGDFGNNARGNRTDLKIYRIAKSDVQASDAVTASVINFSYSDQTDFTPQQANSTNFDCEALIAYNDSLFLFSKDWLDNKTRLYVLPAKPGTYTAEKLDELDVKGLITGAEILATQRVIVLTGYSQVLTPFIYMLYDFSGNNFFGANKRKVALKETFTQVEGICAKTATTFFVSNEKYTQFPINTPARVDQLNLASLLNPYYQSQAASASIATNPASINANTFATARVVANKLYISNTDEKAAVKIYDLNAVLKIATVTKGSQTIVDLSTLPTGLYVVKIERKSQQYSIKFYKE